MKGKSIKLFFLDKLIGIDNVLENECFINF